MATYGMSALYGKTTQALENVMENCADGIMRMMAESMKCDLPKWDNKWDTFFLEHDRAIKVSPLLVLQGNNGVLNAVLSNLNDKQEAAIRTVTNIMDPLYREYLESYQRSLVEQITGFAKMYDDMATQQMLDIIEAYNRKAGRAIDAQTILDPFIPPTIIAYYGIIVPTCYFEITATIREWLSFPYTSTSVYKIAMAIKPHVIKRFVDEGSLAIEKEIRKRFSEAKRIIKDRFASADSVYGDRH